MSAPDRLLPRNTATAASHTATGNADVLTDLREATRDIHGRLDACLPLSRENASLHDYALHLSALGGWLAGLAPVLAVPGVPTAWAPRHAQRLRLVAADLQDCDEPPRLENGTDAAALDRLRQDALAEPAAAWGVAYVIEGSQLGGRMLHRRLQARLAPHPLRYLAGDGDRGGWPAFTAQLRAAVDTPARSAAACASALAAFGVLVRRFERLGALA